MVTNSDIAWTHHTFNPWVGCTKVSPACDRCYAEAWAKRVGSPKLWQGERRRTSTQYWRQPLLWDRAAYRKGIRERVFCASLADVFDNQVPDDWRADLWELIRATKNLDWLLLTKRPQNILKMLPPAYGIGHAQDCPWPNVWLGATVENQEEADRRIPHLLAAPAKIRFLSCEPLLGPLDLTMIPTGGQVGDLILCEDALRGPPDMQPGNRLDWVIFGGESGGGRRELDIENHLRPAFEECVSAHVKVFTKQDSGPRPGMRGRIPDDLWKQEFPA